jgi:hypothetical protein
MEDLSLLYNFGVIMTWPLTEPKKGGGRRFRQEISSADKVKSRDLMIASRDRMADCPKSGGGSKKLSMA